MGTYTVDIIRHTVRGSELLERKEWSGVFEGWNFKNLVQELFGYAASSIDYHALSAWVGRDGREVFCVTCDTEPCPEGIRADVSVARPQEKFVRLRRMWIAKWCEA